MKLFRNPAFLAAVAVTVLLSIYLGLVAQRALDLLAQPEAVAKLMGAALLVLPALGVWYVISEWRLGTAVQSMSSELERQERLPVFAGRSSPSGRLDDADAAIAVELASREVEFSPEDWAAWFHVAWAYDAAGDRRQARRCLRHAAELYRSTPPSLRSR